MWQQLLAGDGNRSRNETTDDQSGYRLAGSMCLTECMRMYVCIYFTLRWSSFAMRAYKVCKKCNCLLSRAHTQLRMRARINNIITYIENVCEH